MGFLRRCHNMEIVRKEEDGKEGRWEEDAEEVREGEAQEVR